MMHRSLYPAPQPLTFTGFADDKILLPPLTLPTVHGTAQDVQAQSTKQQCKLEVTSLPSDHQNYENSAGPSVHNAKLAFMGLDNAGKTTLLRLLRDNRISVHQPTLHAHTEQLMLDNIRFQALDLGGHEIARSLWKKYALGVEGIVFLVDAADRSRFAEAFEELQHLLNEPLLSHIPIAVLAQKMDLPEAVCETEFRQAFDHDKDGVWSDVARVQVFFCTIFQRANYGDAFTWLLTNAPAVVAARAAAHKERSMHTRALFAAMTERCDGGPSLYGQFDANGIPTHNTDGCALESHEVARCRKIAFARGMLPTFQS